MTQWIKLLACDPSMANWGLAKMEVHPETLELRVVDLRLLVTEGLAGKTVRKSSDDVRRASEAYVAASDWAQWADLIAAEVPLGAQSSRAAISYGMCVMGLAALGQIRPLIQMDPYEVKKTVTGRKNATKGEMVDWATKRWPAAPWKRARNKKDGAFTLDNEHMADACAIGVTALTTTEFKSAVTMLRVMRRSSGQQNLVALLSA